MAVDLERRIGDYDLVERIAQTPTCKVYKARRPDGTMVALKLAEKGQEQKLIAESAVLESLNHPNITRFVESHHDSESTYLITFLYPKSVRKLINEERKLEPLRAVKLTKDVLGALVYAHDKEIAHRDLKPDNILLNNAAMAVICDFGTAAEKPLKHTLTTGKAEGTLDYQAPEQRTRQGDSRSDMYAVGVILYELLTSKVPDRKYKPASQIVSSPILLDSLIDRCLDEDPDKRPTAQEGLDLLNTLGEPSEHEITRLLEQNASLKRQLADRKYSLKPRAIAAITGAAFLTGLFIGYSLTKTAQISADAAATYSSYSDPDSWYTITPGESVDTLHFPIGLDPVAGQTRSIPIKKNASTLLRRIFETAEANDRKHGRITNEHGEKRISYTPWHIEEMLDALGAPAAIMSNKCNEAYEGVLRGEGFGFIQSIGKKYSTERSASQQR